MRDGGDLQMAPPCIGIYGSASPLIGTMRSSTTGCHSTATKPGATPLGVERIT
jgi:hypothetical protein